MGLVQTTAHVLTIILVIADTQTLMVTFVPPHTSLTSVYIMEMSADITGDPKRKTMSIYTAKKNPSRFTMDLLKDIGRRGRLAEFSY